MHTSIVSIVAVFAAGLDKLTPHVGAGNPQPGEYTERKMIGAKADGTPYKRNRVDTLCNVGGTIITVSQDALGLSDVSAAYTAGTITDARFLALAARIRAGEVVLSLEDAAPARKRRTAQPAPASVDAASVDSVTT